MSFRAEGEKSLKAWAYRSESLGETSEMFRSDWPKISPFRGNTKKGITKTLAERLALLLEDDLDKRREISNRAVEILQTRGKVVHTGQPDDEKKLLEQLPLAFEYTSGSLVTGIAILRDKEFEVR